MYIVRDKVTKEILHINPAPLSQGLASEEVYHAFDAETMEIGRSDAPAIPAHFEIDATGVIVELTMQQKIDAGMVKLRPEEKLVDDTIVEKTLSEKVADNVIELPATHMVVGEGTEERIEEKPVSQQVAEGVRELQPNEKLVGEEIQEKTTQEQIDEGLITRDEVKERSIQRLRREIEAHFSERKTTSGYRLDALARQKASFSYPYRSLPYTDETKQRLLNDGLIYPNVVLDEILEEVGKVQAAYAAAKQTLVRAYNEGAPVETWESITILDYM